MITGLKQVGYKTQTNTCGASLGKGKNGKDERRCK